MFGRAISAWTGLVIGRPRLVLLVLAGLTIASLFAATQLSINTNQLDLISRELQEVADVKRVDDMIGGTGHLILALRGVDEEQLKFAADALNKRIIANEDSIREVTYRVSVDFLQRNAALFMKTEDLSELRTRVMTKLRDAIKRANPFFMEIEPTEPYKLKLDDIIDKYTKIGQKSITDDYYISDDRQMLLLLVKPRWTNNQLAKTGELLQWLRADFGVWSKSNDQKLQLVEDYTEAPSEVTQTIEFGFAGTYKTNYDDSMDIKNSLVPVSGIALLGVMFVLLLFFRGRILSAAIVVTGLVIGVVLTLGFTWLVIGELNMITSILGGILMGFGIDFGIHLLFRLSEELQAGKALDEALTITIRTAGVASLVSGLGTAAAFLSLLFSEFAGFSQFGLIAGAGVWLIGTTIYAFVPASLALLEQRRPGSAARLLKGLSTATTSGKERRIARPGMWLLLTLVAASLLIIKAPSVGFELNTRALMVENNHSVRLGDEIGHRFRISSDPVGVYSKDIPTARKVYDALNPPKEKGKETIAQVISMFTFVPPADQQARNVKVLAEWRAELAELDRKSMPPEYDKRWDEVMRYLSAKRYDVHDLPPHIKEMFTHLPETKPENHGFLTFIYAGVDLWDGEKMLAFADEVREFKDADGGVHRAAGMAPLMARLVRIILYDGKFSVALTLVLLLVLLLVDLRSLRSAMVALVPLVIGVGVMLGAMSALELDLNLMNIVVFPIVLGYGVSHGVYLMHRFNEGASPIEALGSVGAAVACSTVTTLAGWAALLAAAHRGLKSMGTLACVGMTATMLVTFTLMPVILQLLHDRRTARQKPQNVE